MDSFKTISASVEVIPFHDVTSVVIQTRVVRQSVTLDYAELALFVGILSTRLAELDTLHANRLD